MNGTQCTLDLASLSYGGNTSMMPGYNMATPKWHVMDISVVQILQGKI